MRVTILRHIFLEQELKAEGKSDEDIYSDLKKLYNATAVPPAIAAIDEKAAATVVAATESADTSAINAGVTAPEAVADAASPADAAVVEGVVPTNKTTAANQQPAASTVEATGNEQAVGTSAAPPE